MNQILNYKIPDKLNYIEEELIKYVCVLTDWMPVFGLEEEIIVFVPKNKFTEVIRTIGKTAIEQKDGVKLANLRKTLELSKKDFWKDFEEEIFKIVPVPIRIPYPHHLKLVEISLNRRISASSIIRTVFIRTLEEILRSVKSAEGVRQDVLEFLEKRLIEMASIKNREETFSEDITCHIDIQKTEEDFWTFFRTAVTKTAEKRGVPEELMKIFLSYLSFGPTIFFRLESSEKGLILKIQPHFYPSQRLGDEKSSEVDVSEDEVRKLLVDFPVTVLKKFDAEEIKKFGELTEFEPLLYLSVEEINSIKNEIQANPDSVDSIIEKMYDIVNKNRLKDVIERIERAKSGQSKESHELLSLLFHIYYDNPVNPFDPEFNMESYVWDTELMYRLWEVVFEINIPLVVRKDGVYIEGMEDKGDISNVNVLEDYIYEEYCRRFELREGLNFSDVVEKGLPEDNLNLVLKTIDESIATLGARKFAHLIALELKKIFYLGTSRVFTTTFPPGMVDLIRLFTGKRPKEIVTSALEEGRV